MSLSAADLEAIRQIVRDELWRAGQSSGPAEVAAEAEKVDDGWLAEFLGDAGRRAMQPVPNTPFIGTHDAARVAGNGAGADAIRGWIKKGLLTRNMVRGKLMVSREELDAFLASRRR